MYKNFIIIIIVWFFWKYSPRVSIYVRRWIKRKISTVSRYIIITMILLFSYRNNNITSLFMNEKKKKSKNRAHRIIILPAYTLRTARSGAPLSVNVRPIPIRNYIQFCHNILYWILYTYGCLLLLLPIRGVPVCVQRAKIVWFFGDYYSTDPIPPIWYTYIRAFR